MYEGFWRREFNSLTVKVWKDFRTILIRGAPAVRLFKNAELLFFKLYFIHL